MDEAQTVDVLPRAYARGSSSLPESNPEKKRDGEGVCWVRTWDLLVALK